MGSCAPRVLWQLPAVQLARLECGVASCILWQLAQVWCAVMACIAGSLAGWWHAVQVGGVALPPGPWAR